MRSTIAGGHRVAKVAREAFVPAESRHSLSRTAVALANGRSLNLPLATGKLLTEAYLLRPTRCC